MIACIVSDVLCGKNISFAIKSKFNTMPPFAKSNEGHIGFQGDHGEIWYRNIRIRKL